MDYKTIEKRLQAAQAIFAANEITKSTFDHLHTLLHGIHPKLNTALASASKAGKRVFQLQSGDVIELTVEGLPEGTEKEKKRKKAVLLLFKFWTDLKNETARVEKEFAKDPNTTIQGKTSAWGNILSAAKGPLGAVTLIAAGLVALKVTEVSVVIRNSGCEPMTPMTRASVTIPGFTIPSETIPSGGSAVAKVPPLTVRVDATQTDRVVVTMYGMTYTFQLDASGVSFVFDGKPLNASVSTLSLGDKKEHELVVSCAVQEIVR